MALDEVTQICPVPLPFWLADSGGKGVQIIPVVHGEAQLRSRWDDDGAQVVMDTCGAKVWLPGITDPKTLKMASELCGQAGYRLKGQEHESLHDVMTPGMIRQLTGAVRAGRPRRPVPGRCPPADGLERPALQAGQAPGLGRVPRLRAGRRSGRPGNRRTRGSGRVGRRRAG